MRAMNKAMKANEDTSTNSDKPLGRPMASMGLMVVQSGRRQGAPMRKGRYMGAQTNKPIMAKSMARLTHQVAQAHPIKPMPGCSSSPKASQMDRGILTTKASTWIRVMTRGCPRLWLSVLNMRNSKAGASAKDKMAR